MALLFKQFPRRYLDHQRHCMLKLHSIDEISSRFSTIMKEGYQAIKLVKEATKTQLQTRYRAGVGVNNTPSSAQKSTLLRNCPLTDLIMSIIDIKHHHSICTSIHHVICYGPNRPGQDIPSNLMIIGVPDL